MQMNGDSLYQTKIIHVCHLSLQPDGGKIRPCIFKEKYLHMTLIYNNINMDTNYNNKKELKINQYHRYTLTRSLISNPSLHIMKLAC